MKILKKIPPIIELLCLIYGHNLFSSSNIFLMHSTTIDSKMFIFLWPAKMQCTKLCIIYGGSILTYSIHIQSGPAIFTVYLQWYYHLGKLHFPMQNWGTQSDNFSWIAFRPPIYLQSKIESSISHCHSALKIGKNNE